MVSFQINFSHSSVFELKTSNTTNYFLKTDKAVVLVNNKIYLLVDMKWLKK